MRRFAQGNAFARVRAVTGSLFVLFGAAIVARTLSAVGLTAAAITPLIMGFALIALGALRVRQYFVFRGRGA